MCARTAAFRQPRCANVRTARTANCRVNTVRVASACSLPGPTRPPTAMNETEERKTRSSSTTSRPFVCGHARVARCVFPVTHSVVAHALAWNGVWCVRRERHREPGIERDREARGTERQCSDSTSRCMHANSPSRRAARGFSLICTAPPVCCPYLRAEKRAFNKCSRVQRPPLLRAPAGLLVHVKTPQRGIIRNYSICAGC